MTINCSHPQYLWLLPVVWGFTIWILRGSLAELGTVRERLAAGVRLLLLTLLVLALSGVRLVKPTESLCTVYAVDVSDSIGPRQRTEVLRYIKQARKKMRPGDQAALVAFGAEALLDHAPDDRTEIGQILSTPTTSRTDIAAGLRLALASFPTSAGKQVVLFSDGNENLGNAVDQAGLARGSDVRVTVVPLAREIAGGEVLLRRAEAPATVRQGAPFTVSVLAEATRATDATLELLRNDEAVQQRKIHLSAGKTVVAFPETLSAGGVYRYKAVLEASKGADSVPDNNIAYVDTKVTGKPQVLLVEGTPGDGTMLARALQANDVQVARGGPERVPATLAECAQYDSIILDNVPAWRISPSQQAILQAAVRDMGDGLLMIGGEESFGAGGYYHTPIEEALPVSMDSRKRKKFPPLALALVIENLEIPETVNMSIEAAKASVNLLEPIDQAGVLGCSGTGNSSADWPIPMQYVTNKAGMQNQMSRLVDLADPPNYDPYLLEAAQVLQGTKAGVKHIILFGDGDAVYEQSQGALAADMQQIRKMGITVSTITTAPDSAEAVKFMAGIAQLGGGYAYVAEQPQDLRNLLLRDQQTVSKPPTVEERFQVHPVDTSHEVSRGIAWNDAPPLMGYVVASMKETPSARQLLTSHTGDPVLAAWSYGLGRSVAFTSDATAHWGAYWLGWSGYPAFWTQAVRWTLRQGEASDFQTMVTEDHGRATVQVDAATSQGVFRNLLDLRAHVTHVVPGGLVGTPKAEHEELPLVQTAPGRYTVDFETRETGRYQVTVEERDHNVTRGTQTASLVIPYSPEFQTVQPNLTLLQQVAERTRGAFDPPAGDIFDKLRFGAHTLQDLWPTLLAILAVLFLLDVALRRILLPWTEVCQLAWQAIVRRLPAWRFAAATSAPAHTPLLDSLLTVKGKSAPPRAEESDAATLRELRRQAREAMPSAAALPPEIPAETSAPSPAPTSLPTTTRVLLQKKRERKDQ